MTRRLTEHTHQMGLPCTGAPTTPDGMRGKMTDIPTKQQLALEMYGNAFGDCEPTRLSDLDLGINHLVNCHCLYWRKEFDRFEGGLSAGWRWARIYGAAKHHSDRVTITTSPIGGEGIPRENVMVFYDAKTGECR